jgi:hypothetical protein
MNARSRWFCIGSGAVILLAAGCFFVVRSLIAQRTVMRSQQIALRLQEELGTETRQVLDSNQKLTLYSLDPDSMHTDPQELKKKPDFHGYLILGKTSITDAKTQSDLLAAFYDGIGSSSRKEMAFCFEPRHGIRAVGNNKSIDLVICFHCKQLEIYENQGKRTIPVTDSPRPVFDRILSQAGIPLASR